MSLVSYWYIDKQGIDSLLAQISSELLQEEHVKIIHKGSGNVGGSVGFAEVLRQFFNADVSMSGGIEKTHEIQKVELKTYEEKIQQLKNYIEKNEVLMCTKDEMLTKYNYNKSNFFFGTLELDLKSNWVDWKKMQETIKKWGYIQFYKSKEDASNYNDYNYNDNYFKSYRANSFDLIMSMGVDKMQTSFSGTTSHFAVYTRNFEGHDIPLGIFGHVYKHSSESFQIKPYAVWIR